MQIASNSRNIDFNRLFFLLITIYYSLSTIMPAVAYYISAYLYMAAVLLVFILILLRNRENFNSYFNFMLPLLFIIILQILNTYINKKGSLPLFIYNEILYLVPTILIYYLLVNNNRSMIKILTTVAIAGLVITAITTYFGLLNNPSAARILATISDSKDPNAIYWWKQNIGGFEIIYSIVILNPLIICLYKQKKLPFIIFIIIFTILLLCIIESQYAIALLMFVSSSFLIFVKRVFKTKNLWSYAIIFICAYFLLKPLISEFMQYLGATVSSYTLSERFNFIGDLMNGVSNNSDVGNRIDRYMASLQYFVKYPVFGSWIHVRYGDGGHSFILDTLAEYGLVGGSALFVFFRHIYLKLYRPFKGTDYYGFIVFSFILFIVLSFLNTTKFLFVLCFLVPGIAYIIQDKNYVLDGKGVTNLESNVGV